MNSKLRYWVKLDSKNVPVGGSNVNRPKRPTSGSWIEIFKPDCCGPEIRYTPTLPVTNIVLTLSCDAVAKVTTTATADASTIVELAGYLNQNVGYLGVFSVDGTELVFQVSKKVKDTICPDGTLTFTVN